MTAQMFVVRTTASLELVSRIAREQIRSVDRENVQVVQVLLPIARVLDRPLARPRSTRFCSARFSTAALLLAAIGLYAVMSAFVRQRDREIAVRLALGATSAHVRGLVLGETARLAGLGALTGLVIAVVATKAIRGAFHDAVSLESAHAARGRCRADRQRRCLVSLVPMRRAVLGRCGHRAAPVICPASCEWRARHRPGVAGRLEIGSAAAARGAKGQRLQRDRQPRGGGTLAPSTSTGTTLRSRWGAVSISIRTMASGRRAGAVPPGCGVQPSIQSPPARPPTARARG